MYDVAIVGGGPAGLAAAYHLERGGLSAIVLEETDRLGGRALTVDVQGQPVNLGAMFVYSGTASHDLALDLGVPLVPFEPASFGIHVNGETVVAKDNSQLVANLPLPQTSKDALLGFIERASREYFNNTVDGQLRPASKEYGETSAQAQLDGLPADVQEILEAGIRGGSVARPSELSATYALRYFASYLTHEKNNRMFASNGMESIPAALARNLVTTEVRTRCSVRSVRQDAAGNWEITAAAAGDTAMSAEQQQGEPSLDVRARHVIMAVPAPRIAEIAELPDWKKQALEKVQTPGSTVLGVVADVRNAEIPAIAGTPSPVQLGYDDWSFVVTPGRPFDAVINPLPGRGDGIAQFVCYGNSSGYLPGANQADSGVLEQWLEEFLAVAPGLRHRIIGARIRSWRHCFSLLTPERNAALPLIRKPVAGSMHFAGDYSSETAGTHGAYAEAQRVVEEILAHASEAFGARQTADAFVEPIQ
ncbi:flavin monoamine oxidase family protein [Arthrobacter sp. GCM10027362]|uniref:flavin monoamine oxidase family protein n=1 Tax=Arthrobacter sp. GCM10027362 TaxID=3273379 RepID=UPI003629B7AD